MNCELVTEVMYGGGATIYTGSEKLQRKYFWKNHIGNYVHIRNEVFLESRQRLQARGKRQEETCNFAFCILLKPRLQARGKRQETTCNIQHAILPFACCLNQGFKQEARGKRQHATCNFAFCMLLKPRLSAQQRWSSVGVPKWSVNDPLWHWIES